MKTVSKIVKGLESVMNDLHNHAVERRAKQAESLAKAVEHTAEASVHRQEAEKAEQIGSNIAQLLGKEKAS